MDRKIALIIVVAVAFADSCHSLQTAPVTQQGASKVCILGGGFGGLNTALSILSLPWHTRPEITLVDKKERFVFLPLLYELCVGDAPLEEVAPTYRDLLKDTGIKCVTAEINGVDVENDVVFLDGNGESRIDYDALVIATGMQVNLSGVKGAEECALPFYTVEDCFELRKRLSVLDKFEESQNVVIVGAGYSGVELALNMKERLNNCKVSIVHRGADILQGSTEFNRESSKKSLESAGIEIMTRTEVTSIAPVGGSKPVSSCELTLRGLSKNDDIKRRSADLLLWTAGGTPAGGVLNSKLPRDKNGRIVTGSQLRVNKYPKVFAIGDGARGRKDNYAATAQVAMQQAPIAAWNVFSTLNDGTLLPFRFLDLGEMMTLGGDDATISSLGGQFQINGQFASLARRLIYSARMPTSKQVLTSLSSTVKSKVERRVQSKYAKK